MASGRAFPFGIGSWPTLLRKPSRRLANQGWSGGRTTGAIAQATLSPGAGLRVASRVRTVAAGVAAEIFYRRRLDGPVLEVWGTIAAGVPAEERSVAVVNPTIFFAQSLKDALIARGIDVTGAAADIDDIAAELAGQTVERRVLASTSSPRVAEIAEHDASVA